MLQSRIFPCLLLQGEGLVKTVRFKDPTYIGDPINAVRIFNLKQVDELLFLDITATEEKRPMNIALIKKISEECSMPLTVGGGIKTVEDIRALLNAGVEKVSINTQAVLNPGLITEASQIFGRQAIVVSMDVKKEKKDYRVYTHGGRKSTSWDPISYAVSMEKAGAGEIFLNSIDCDGTMQGYDLKLIKKVTEAVTIPVIACGGCGKIEDLRSAIVDGGASAATAGSFFVFHGPRRAVLISFPSRAELETLFKE
ncbi:MAG: imidazole glycerol phosphate synthase subunit HisF [Candidatus Omnitrophica bacterium]|nr:imidazole glycerol phosphate synthase subunit HisF [Candidatus Omnitrophota bacterium]